MAWQPSVISSLPRVTLAGQRDDLVLVQVRELSSTVYISSCVFSFPLRLEPVLPLRLLATLLATFMYDLLSLSFFKISGVNSKFYKVAIKGNSGETRVTCASSGESKKIVGVFYKANEYASKNPNFLGCVENSLGIRNWLESQGHQYIVTDDKEGPDCGGGLSKEASIDAQAIASIDARSKSTSDS
uniref:Uncharacterized protein n=1 Tax=Brassica oleracea var. oleracea TaxID=109376 RepID=A0A0D3AJ35_BRAOL